ncbi:tyrosine-type recombinase/integrase [Zhengella sp. ZM62]|uniref:tyrosine-type recombinase/integrase n=1 Tax=Zhengella sedimenti TaxID=3390035 RepID=UPI0039763CBA
MIAKNPTNERTKRDYFHHLKQALGRSDQTVRQVARSLTRFEDFNGRRDFKTFDQRQAVGFKEKLVATGLASATTLSTLNDLKLFFGWLALQPGFKRAIKLSDIDYFNLSEKAVRAATAPADKEFPSLPMVEKVVAAMPMETAIEKRDRALIAFTAVTGIRDGALITLKLKHFDEARRLVLQNPIEVSTKFSKRIDTFLFPLNDTFEVIFLEWVAYLRTVELFGDHDPLFPKTAMGQDKDRCLKANGLSREHWANASPVRAIFKAAFRNAGLPEFTPHRFRNMIVSEMYRRQLAVPVFKAWSQNLGHEGAMTTLTSYGKIGLEEQGRLVRNPGSQEPNALLDEIKRLIGKP